MNPNTSLPDTRTMKRFLQVCLWAWKRGRRFFHDSDVYSVDWFLPESEPTDGIERLRKWLSRP